MRTTEAANVTLPGFSDDACAAHVFPALASGSLISTGQLCDDNCWVVLDANTAIVTRTKPIITDTPILIANRDPHGDKLWHIPFSNDTNKPVNHQGSVNNVAPTTTVPDHVAWLHAAMFSPALSTLCTAIDAGRLTTFPTITSTSVRRYPPNSKPMIQGHLDHSRKNLRSTQGTFDTDDDTKQAATPTSHPSPSASNAEDSETAEERSPGISDPPAIRTRHLYAKHHPVSGAISTDQTGTFLCQSASGNTDMMIFYDYDSNAIHVEPMQGKTSTSILEAYTRALATFQSKGLAPKIQRLDNEASQALQKHMQDNKIDFQLAPPHCHRRNAATWLSLKGGRGDAGVGWSSALVRSCAAAIARSSDDARGRATLVGCHTSVSVIRSAWVSSTQTR